MADNGVLILGGTSEARRLADALADAHGGKLRVITSLAGRTQAPRLPKGEVRQGGFGGTDGLVDYLTDTGIGLLIDATHPYAAQISDHAHKAAETTGVPRLMLMRPPWQAGPGDRWTGVADIRAAVGEIPRSSDACLITTGVNDLEAFAPIVSTKLFVRVIDDPGRPLPLRGAEMIVGKPPYSKSDEIALMRLMGIDLLVTKNAGGEATRAKIDAARELGIPVIMIERPPAPPGETVATLDAALAAVEKKFGLG